MTLGKEKPCGLFFLRSSAGSLTQLNRKPFFAIVDGILLRAHIRLDHCVYSE